MSLRKFDDNDIANIENMVRNELKNWLNTNVAEADFTDFFGPIYFANPEEFRFRCGDVKMVKGISDHIKSTVETKGYGYFVPGSSRSEQYVNVEDLTSQLFDAALNLLQPYGENVTCHFHPYMVNVEVVDGKIKGGIHCILCDLPDYAFKKSQARSRKHFYLQHWKGHQWLVSNFSTHLNSHIAKEEDVMAKDATSTDTAGEIASQSIAPDSDDLIVSEMVLGDITTLNLSAALRIHEIQMTNFANQNRMQLGECKVEIDPGSTSSIWVCPIPADGSCLFSAIVHQHFYLSVGSEEHVLKGLQLRKEIVDHIKANVKRFQSEILGSLFKDDTYVDDPEAACKQFIERLPEPGTWGGAESLRAFSECFSTNVIVFNENGDVYFGSPFNPSYQHVITLAYRVKKNSYPLLRYHYDSVVKISDVVLQKTTSQLIEKYKTSCALQQLEVIPIE